MQERDRRIETEAEFSRLPPRRGVNPVHRPCPHVPAHHRRSRGVPRHEFVLLGDEFLAAAAQSRGLLHTPTPHQYRISVPAAATTVVTTTTSIICTAPSFPFPHRAHAYSDVVQEQLLVGDQSAMAKKLEDHVFDEGPIFDEELVRSQPCCCYVLGDQHGA
jgi:hypothetical protein